MTLLLLIFTVLLSPGVPSTSVLYDLGNTVPSPPIFHQPRPFIAEVDTPFYMEGSHHDNPGRHLRTIHSGGWRIEYYQGMLLANRIGISRIDTVYLSYCDSTFLRADSLDRDTSQTVDQENFSLLSIVGDVVSYECVYYSDGGMHPSYGSSFHMLRLGELNEPVPITMFFSENEVCSALVADTLVQKYLAMQHPSNLAQLMRNLDGGCEWSFGNMLTSWYISDIKQDSAIVTFGVPRGAEACRGASTVISVSLAIHRAAERIFREAKVNRTTCVDLDR